MSAEIKCFKDIQCKTELNTNESGQYKIDFLFTSDSSYTGKSKIYAKNVGKNTAYVVHASTVQDVTITLDKENIRPEDVCTVSINVDITKGINQIKTLSFDLYYDNL